MLGMGCWCLPPMFWIPYIHSLIFVNLRATKFAKLREAVLGIVHAPNFRSPLYLCGCHLMQTAAIRFGNIIRQGKISMTRLLLLSWEQYEPCSYCPYIVGEMRPL